jgi:hypothetical protein
MGVVLNEADGPPYRLALASVSPANPTSDLPSPLGLLTDLGDHGLGRSPLAEMSPPSQFAEQISAARVLFNYWSKVLAQPPASYLSKLLRCSMRLSRIVFLALITISVATLAKAQQQDWIPQGIESLGQNASSRTEFTLDHSMLVFASKLDQDDDLRSSANEITVKETRRSCSGSIGRSLLFIYPHN